MAEYQLETIPSYIEVKNTPVLCEHLTKAGDERYRIRVTSDGVFFAEPINGRRTACVLAKDYKGNMNMLKQAIEERALESFNERDAKSGGSICEPFKVLIVWRNLKGEEGRKTVLRASVKHVVLTLYYRGIKRGKGDAGRSYSLEPDGPRVVTGCGCFDGLQRQIRMRIAGASEIPVDDVHFLEAIMVRHPKQFGRVDDATEDGPMNLLDVGIARENYWASKLRSDAMMRCVDSPRAKGGKEFGDTYLSTYGGIDIGQARNAEQLDVAALRGEPYKPSRR